MSRRTTGLVIGGSVAFLLFTGAVTMRTMKSREAFTEYRERTIGGDQAPWASRAHSVPECIDASIEWTLACQGVQSWCDATFPSVLTECLDSSSRDQFCADAGDEVKSTRFGFAACEARWTPISAKYERRATKKHCATAYRAIAAHCTRA